MESLRILISGTPAGSTAHNLRLEHEALAHAIYSLRAPKFLNLEFGLGQWSRDQALDAVRKCDIYGVLCGSASGGWIKADESLQLPEIEIAEAVRLKKPIMILIPKRLVSESDAARQRQTLLQELETANYPYDLVEFADLDQLEEQATEIVSALLIESFHMTVSRPLFQAPLPLTTFVGREAKIREIIDALARGGTVVIHGLGDFGGLGKTELAIYAAHRLRDVFRDGVLWASLPTTRPDETLLTWLRAYGGVASLGQGDLRFEFRPVPVEVRKIEETTIRADILRDLIHGKRILAILDGVVDETDNEKLSPLMRGLKGCTVLVTSRVRHLASLPDAVPIDLDRMSPAETFELLNRIAGPSRINDDQAAAADLGRLLDLTPLAIHITASLLREQPGWTLADLIQKVQEERGKLDRLNWGYPRARGNRAALNLSYAHLTTDERRFISALGAFGGNDMDPAAASYVASVPLPNTPAFLERMEHLGLVQQRQRPGRFLLHPVVRSYAREKLFDPVESHGEHASAELRMATYYCNLAKEHGRSLQGPGIHSALSVLDRELSNIFAGQKWAYRRNDRSGWDLCRDYISGAMTYYFSIKAMWSDWILWSNSGIEACRKLGDERNASAIAASLGMVYFRKGDMDQANELFMQSLDMMEKMGHLPGLATIYMNLGNVKTHQREWNQAITFLLKSLQMRERLGDMHGMAQTRANIGMLYAKRGEIAKARAQWVQALEMLEHISSEHEADIVRKWLKKLPSAGRGQAEF